MSEAQQFLSALFLPSGELDGDIGICQSPTFTATWFPCTEAGVWEASQHAERAGSDVYVHMTVHDRSKAGSRGNNSSATTLVCLWADIDLAEANKDNQKKYPPRDVALDVINSLPFPPSVLVNSGNGLHAYWLLTSPARANDYQDLPKRWQAYLGQQLVDPQTGEAFDLDGTGDPARVLRVPGTVNSKGGNPVQILVADSDRRYSIEQFVSMTEDLQASSTSAPAPGSVSITVDTKCAAPAGLETLLTDPYFRNLWEHQSSHLRDTSPSGYDNELAKYAAAREWPDQAICDLLVAHRRRYVSDEKDVKKLGRADYYRRTIAVARSSLSGRSDEKKCLFDQYAYVLIEKRFYDRQTLLDIDKDQFADKTCRVIGSRKAPDEFLKRKDTLLVDSVTYRVNGPQTMTEDGLEKLNLWDGHRIAPIEGDISAFLDHMDYLFEGEPEARHYFLDWMAHVVQHPDIKILAAPLLIGGQGIGKSVLGAVMRAILGRDNATTVENNELRGDYNEWMRHTALVVIEELMTLGRQETMNKLKPLITEQEVRINRKYVQIVTMPNRVNFLFFSNHTDAAKLEAGDRRYFVHVTDAKPRGSEHYDKLWRLVKKPEGIAAIAHYLHARDLSKFDPNSRPPMTKGKELVIQESRSPAETALHTLFEEESKPFDRDLLTVESVRTHMNTISQSHGIQRGVTSTMVRRFLKEIGAVNLGQKRIGQQKPRVWAIRRTELWEQANEKTIAEYLEPLGEARRLQWTTTDPFEQSASSTETPDNE